MLLNFFSILETHHCSASIFFNCHACHNFAFLNDICTVFYKKFSQIVKSRIIPIFVYLPEVRPLQTACDLCSRKWHWFCRSFCTMRIFKHSVLILMKMVNLTFLNLFSFVSICSFVTELWKLHASMFLCRTTMREFSHQIGFDFEDVVTPKSKLSHYKKEASHCLTRNGKTIEIRDGTIQGSAGKNIPENKIRLKGNNFLYEILEYCIPLRLC